MVLLTRNYLIEKFLKACVHACMCKDVLVTFLTTVTKIPDRNNLREEGFILTHVFGNFSLFWWGGCGRSHLGS
jgi:hypothetical protein